jgi:hypothetical protein
MRRGTSGASIRRLDDGRLESVNLGADYCAEHEWGIERLERDFGLDAKAKPGIPRRKVNVVPSGLRLDHEKASSVLLYNPYSWVKDVPISNELQPYEYKGAAPWEVIGGWSGEDFGARLLNRQDAVDLYDAFQRLDVAFLFGSTFGNPFARGGLVLAIVSRLPTEIVASLEEMARDDDALKRAVDKTGIADRLRKAGEKAPREGYIRRFSYYALNPRWKDDTKTEVIFWLNPMEQQKNNFGWFTVADLDDWIAGKGKIPKETT